MATAAAGRERGKFPSVRKGLFANIHRKPAKAGFRKHGSKLRAAVPSTRSMFGARVNQRDAEGLCCVI